MKATKKEIINKWKISLIELDAYSNTKFYKVLEPCIIGVELINIRNTTYKPYFVLYPLWEQTIKDCFNKPLLFHGFYSNKHIELKFSYENENIDYNKTINKIKNDTLISFSGDIKLNIMEEAINKYLQFPIIIAQGKHQILNTYYLMFYVNLFKENYKNAELIFSQLSEFKNEKLMIPPYNNMTSWLSSLEENLDNNYALIFDSYNNNIRHNKVKKLTFSEII